MCTACVRMIFCLLRRRSCTGDSCRPVYSCFDVPQRMDATPLGRNCSVRSELVHGCRDPGIGVENVCFTARSCARFPVQLVSHKTQAVLQSRENEDNLVSTRAMTLIVASTSSQRPRVHSYHRRAPLITRAIFSRHLYPTIRTPFPHFPHISASLPASLRLAAERGAARERVCRGLIERLGTIRCWWQ